MPEGLQDSVLAALAQVRDPESGKDVRTLEWVRAVQTTDGVIRVSLAVPADQLTEPLQRQLQAQATAVLQRVPGVRQIQIDIAPQHARGSAGGDALPGVRRVIAVGAGKGGVGKSTIAVMLAVGLQRLGLRVGLLDADVYGPSLPKITGTENEQPHGDADGRIVPPQFDGIPIMSMGFLVDPDQAIIWRGPMAQKYVKEFLDRGRWGELDYLIVDLPPGTGDIPLTLAQSIPLTGAVVVCTPQDVALLDAVKALRMYQKLGVEPLGLLENMSYYLCPQCGHREHIFDHGGCERAAANLGVPFLGAVPLNLAIRINSDRGRPAANFSETEPYVVQALEAVVQRVCQQVQAREAQQRPLPQLNVR